MHFLLEDLPRSSKRISLCCAFSKYLVRRRVYVVRVVSSTIRHGMGIMLERCV